MRSFFDYGICIVNCKGRNNWLLLAISRTISYSFAYTILCTYSRPSILTCITDNLRMYVALVEKDVSKCAGARSLSLISTTFPRPAINAK